MLVYSLECRVCMFILTSLSMFENVTQNLQPSECTWNGHSLECWYVACVECWYNNMTKDGMVTAWSAGMYDQRWNGHSLECWYVRPKMEWSQPGVLVCMIKDVMVTAWSAGMYDQRWNGHGLECWCV